MRALLAASTPATRAEGVSAFATLASFMREHHRNLNGTPSSSNGKGFNLLYLIPILIGALLIIALLSWLILHQWRRRTKRTATLKRTASALLPIVDPSALLVSPGSRDYDRELIQSLHQFDSGDLAMWRASETQRGSSSAVGSNTIVEQFRQSVTDAQSRQLYRRLYGDPNVSAYRLAFQKIVFERMLSSRSSPSNLSTRTWLCQYEGEEIAVKVSHQPSAASVRRRRSLRSSSLSPQATDGDENDDYSNRYEDLRRLMDEIQLTAALEHPHVIRFLGVAWDSMAVESLCLITEYLSMGNLHDLLRGARTVGQEDMMTWAHEKLRLAIGVAKALRYLHSCTMPPTLIANDSGPGSGSGATTPVAPVTILHRDVRAKNVGLSHAFEPKLVNIGAKHGYSNPAELVAMGESNAFWTAPEVLSGRAYSARADVYAFGVLLSEIDTNGQLPYSDRESVQLRPFQVLNQVTAGTLRPAFSQSCPTWIQEITDMCLCTDPALRVNAATLTQLLESYDKSLAQ